MSRLVPVVFDRLVPRPVAGLGLVLVLVLGFGLVLGPVAAAAQRPEPPPPPPPSTEQSLARIADLLELLVDGQSTQLAVRRLELETTRLLTLERALAGAREEQERLAQEAERKALFARSLEGELDARSPTVPEGGMAALRGELERVELAIRQDRARAEELGRSVLALENQLVDRRLDVQELEEMLDERLERPRRR